MFSKQNSSPVQAIGYVRIAFTGVATIANSGELVRVEGLGS